MLDHDPFSIDGDIGRFVHGLDTSSWLVLVPGTGRGRAETRKTSAPRTLAAPRHGPVESLSAPAPVLKVSGGRAAPAAGGGGELGFGSFENRQDVLAHEHPCSPDLAGRAHDARLHQLGDRIGSALEGGA